MFGKRKGMFGAVNSVMPGDQPDYGMGDVGGFRVPTDAGTSLPAAEKKTGGIFGTGINGWQIAGSIGDALREANGLEATYGPAMAQRRQMEFLQQKAQQERETGFADYVRKAEYDRANPKPVNNDTTNDYSFIESKLGADAANQYLRSIGDPVVTVPLGNEKVYSGPRSGLAAALGGGQQPATNTPQPTADAPTILKNASARGYILPDEEAALRPSLGANGTGAFEGWMQAQKIKRVTRTGKSADGRKVIQFSDGTMQYAD